LAGWVEFEENVLAFRRNHEVEWAKFREEAFARVTQFASSADESRYGL
jgi:hypothetical protein